MVVVGGVVSCAQRLVWAAVVAPSEAESEAEYRERTQHRCFAWKVLVKNGNPYPLSDPCVAQPDKPSQKPIPASSEHQPPIKQLYRAVQRGV
eukprot:365802-Chlamydomonas_euryale.AAC.2